MAQNWGVNKTVAKIILKTNDYNLIATGGVKYLNEVENLVLAICISDEKDLKKKNKFAVKLLKRIKDPEERVKLAEAYGVSKDGAEELKGNPKALAAVILIHQEGVDLGKIAKISGISKNIVEVLDNPAQFETAIRIKHATTAEKKQELMEKLLQSIGDSDKQVKLAEAYGVPTRVANALKGDVKDLAIAMSAAQEKDLGAREKIMGSLQDKVANAEKVAIDEVKKHLGDNKKLKISKDVKKEILKGLQDENFVRESDTLTEKN
jgi:hypothetical protein